MLENNHICPVFADAPNLKQYLVVFKMTHRWVPQRTDKQFVSRASVTEKLQQIER